MTVSSRVPSYRCHKQSGQAIVTLTDGLGSRRDVLLGKYGTPQSRIEYARVIAEWETKGRILPKEATKPDLTMNELLVLFMRHARLHYRRPNGTPTSEVDEFVQTFKVVKRLYGHTSARDFGPLALRAVREAMIDGRWLTVAEKSKRKHTGHVIGWARSTINKRVDRIRRCFRWASEQELLPVLVYQGLKALRGLERGRSEARETAPVQPVDPEIVRATLPLLRPQVRALVELQMATGMRPGEVIAMRGCDLTMEGEVWTYRPGSDQGQAGCHKMSYRGQQRVILLGPKAQALLRPWLRLNLQEYLFQPRESVDQFNAERRSHRKTPMSPSQAKRHPKKHPGTRYTGSRYASAVRTAAAKAGVPHWHPHMLRHYAATVIRKAGGLEASRCILGHQSVGITEHYAQQDLDKAREIVKQFG